LTDEFDPEAPGIGHNSVAGKDLLAFIERVERLTEERQTFTDDIKDVYGEAKGRGFDVKAMRKIVALRKIDKDKRAAEEAILETYLLALGMI
jgi:uncharacterized protein (UPF0335 family)